MALNFFPLDLTSRLQLAHQAAATLAMTPASVRNHALEAMAQALIDHQDDILEANTLDLETSREMAVPDLILDWLKLTPERLQTAVELLVRLSILPDPTPHMVSIADSMNHCQAYAQLMPLGVIALVYEALPALGAIAAGFCLRTGNSLILRGGSEASHSNQMIVQTLQTAMEESGLPAGSLVLLPSDQGASMRDLVAQEQYLNLIIPYGRPSLVQQVVRQSTVPVLQSVIGNCYLYWSPTGSLDMSRSMIIDSHQSEPDAVNAIEKVLIHTSYSHSSLRTLLNSLQEKGYELRGDESLVAELPELDLAEVTEWSQPYLSKIIAFKVIDSLDAAIAWINQYSSGHANCLTTESYQESRKFALGVQSAFTYINASPRFCRYSKHGDALALGMSNQRGYCRGMIGLGTLTTIKQVVQG
ncbi:MAG: glutamate-5-semialdehyde dehydrogenase [Cyanothece sp. SIO1E1]|nr:glutamate-5-semialdehyde dehydrogenase [Cyanothece sp. SIO1E1]